MVLVPHELLVLVHHGYNVRSGICGLLEGSRDNVGSCFVHGRFMNSMDQTGSYSISAYFYLYFPCLVHCRLQCGTGHACLGGGCVVCIGYRVLGRVLCRMLDRVFDMVLDMIGIFKCIYTLWWWVGW